MLHRWGLVVLVQRDLQASAHICSQIWRLISVRSAAQGGASEVAPAAGYLVSLITIPCPARVNCGGEVRSALFVVKMSRLKMGDGAGHVDNNLLVAVS